MWREGTFSYAEVISAVMPLVGKRVRLTSFNGYQRVGHVGIWTCHGEEHPTLGAYQSGERWLGGHLMGGEYDHTITKIETMQENGRYAEVCHA